MNLQDIRKEYAQAALNVHEADPSAFHFFRQWLQEALNAKVHEPTAMCLSTIGEDDFPHSRIVLLKELSEEGFVFFTNYTSHKGQQLALNPKACLNFFWPELERQVRVRGIVEKVPAEDSVAYFTSRPVGSQIGAWASPQSEVIPSREYLEEKVAEVQKNYDAENPKRPPHWGGYCLKPVVVEFWQGRPSRLHDRLRYTQNGEGAWKIERLAP